MSYSSYYDIDNLDLTDVDSQISNTTTNSATPLSAPNQPLDWGTAMQNAMQASSYSPLDSIAFEMSTDANVDSSSEYSSLEDIALSANPPQFRSTPNINPSDYSTYSTLDDIQDVSLSVDKSQSDATSNSSSQTSDIPQGVGYTLSTYSDLSALPNLTPTEKPQSDSPVSHETFYSESTENSYSAMNDIFFGHDDAEEEESAPHISASTVGIAGFGGGGQYNYLDSELAFNHSEQGKPPPEHSKQNSNKISGQRAAVPTKIHQTISIPSVSQTQTQGSVSGETAPPSYSQLMADLPPVSRSSLSSGTLLSAMNNYLPTNLPFDQLANYLKTQHIDNWNERFVAILDRKRDIIESILPEIKNRVTLDHIDHLSKELKDAFLQTEIDSAKLVLQFSSCATLFAKIIIDDVKKPFDQKRIQPASDAGGVAGGEKYIYGGMFFKFALDSAGLYGSDARAMLAAKLEIEHLKWIYSQLYEIRESHLDLGTFDVDTETGANFNVASTSTSVNNGKNVKEKLKLYLPLCCLVDYKGYRIIVSATLPLTKTSLIYGSDDAGRTVHKDNAKFNLIMQRIGKHLGLAPHRVGVNAPITGPGDNTGNGSKSNKYTSQSSTSSTSSAKDIYGPVDIEGHLGTDGRFYLLDTARLLPCEASTPTIKVTSFPADDNRNIVELELMRSNFKVELAKFVPCPPEWNSKRVTVNISNAVMLSVARTEGNINGIKFNSRASALVNQPIWGDALLFGSFRGEYLYNLFTPKFLQEYSTKYGPLSPDAFSPFGTDNADFHNKNVEFATNHLKTEIVSKAATQLEKTSSPLDSESLNDIFEKIGLPRRYLGAIRARLPVDSPYSPILLFEMVQDTLIEILNQILREHVSSPKNVVAQALATYFSRILNSRDLEFWSGVKHFLLADYGIYESPIIGDERLPGFSLAFPLNPYALLYRVCSACGVVLSNRVFAELEAPNRVSLDGMILPFHGIPRKHGSLIDSSGHFGYYEVEPCHVSPKDILGLSTVNFSLYNVDAISSSISFIAPQSLPWEIRIGEIPNSNPSAPLGMDADPDLDLDMNLSDCIPIENPADYCLVPEGFPLVWSQYKWIPGTFQRSLQLEAAHLGAIQTVLKSVNHPHSVRWIIDSYLRIAVLSKTACQTSGSHLLVKLWYVYLKKAEKLIYSPATGVVNSGTFALFHFLIGSFHQFASTSKNGFIALYYELVGTKSDKGVDDSETNIGSPKESVDPVLSHYNISLDAMVSSLFTQTLVGTRSRHSICFRPGRAPPKSIPYMAFQDMNTRNQKDYQSPNGEVMVPINKKGEGHLTKMSLVERDMLTLFGNFFSSTAPHPMHILSQANILSIAQLCKTGHPLIHLLLDSLATHFFSKGELIVSNLFAHASLISVIFNPPNVNPSFLRLLYGSWSNGFAPSFHSMMNVVGFKIHSINHPILNKRFENYAQIWAASGGLSPASRNWLTQAFYGVNLGNGIFLSARDFHSSAELLRSINNENENALNAQQQVGLGNDPRLRLRMNMLAEQELAIRRDAESSNTFQRRHNEDGDDYVNLNTTLRLTHSLLSKSPGITLTISTKEENAAKARQLFLRNNRPLAATGRVNNSGSPESLPPTYFEATTSDTNKDQVSASPIVSTGVHSGRNGRSIGMTDRTIRVPFNTNIVKTHPDAVENLPILMNSAMDIFLLREEKIRTALPDNTFSTKLIFSRSTGERGSRERYLLPSLLRWFKENSVQIIKTVTNASNICFISVIGEVYIWGSNEYGQYGNGIVQKSSQSTSSKTLPDPASLFSPPVLINNLRGKVVKDIAMTYPSYPQSGRNSLEPGISVLAMLESGELLSWGSNQYGQTGHTFSAVEGQKNPPILYPKLLNIQSKKFIAISAGGAHFAAIDSDGQVWTFGANSYCQLGHSPNEKSATPHRVNWVKDVGLGYYTSQNSRFNAFQSSTSNISLLVSQKENTLGDNLTGPTGPKPIKPKVSKVPFEFIESENKLPWPTNSFTNSTSSTGDIPNVKTLKAVAVECDLHATYIIDEWGSAFMWGGHSGNRPTFQPHPITPNPMSAGTWFKNSAWNTFLNSTGRRVVKICADKCPDSSVNQESILLLTENGMLWVMEGAARNPSTLIDEPAVSYRKNDRVPQLLWWSTRIGPIIDVSLDSGHYHVITWDGKYYTNLLNPLLSHSLQRYINTRHNSSSIPLWSPIPARFPDFDPVEHQAREAVFQTIPYVNYREAKLIKDEMHQYYTSRPTTIELLQKNCTYWNSRDIPSSIFTAGWDADFVPQDLDKIIDQTQLRQLANLPSLSIPKITDFPPEKQTQARKALYWLAALDKHPLHIVSVLRNDYSFLIDNKTGTPSTYFSCSSINTTSFSRCWNDFGTVVPIVAITGSPIKFITSKSYLLWIRWWHIFKTSITDPETPVPSFPPPSLISLNTISENLIAKHCPSMSRHSSIASYSLYSSFSKSVFSTLLRTISPVRFDRPHQTGPSKISTLEPIYHSSDVISLSICLDPFLVPTETYINSEKAYPQLIVYSGTTSMCFSNWNPPDEQKFVIDVINPTVSHSSLLNFSIEAPTIPGDYGLMYYFSPSKSLNDACYWTKRVGYRWPGLYFGSFSISDTGYGSLAGSGSGDGSTALSGEVPKISLSLLRPKSSLEEMLDPIIPEQNITLFDATNIWSTRSTINVPVPIFDPTSESTLSDSDTAKNPINRVDRVEHNVNADANCVEYGTPLVPVDSVLQLDWDFTSLLPPHFPRHRLALCNRRYTSSLFTNLQRNVAAEARLAEKPIILDINVLFNPFKHLPPVPNSSSRASSWSKFAFPVQQSGLGDAHESQNCFHFKGSTPFYIPSAYVSTEPENDWVICLIRIEPVPRRIMAMSPWFKIVPKIDPTSGGSGLHNPIAAALVAKIPKTLRTGRYFRLNKTGHKHFIDNFSSDTPTPVYYPGSFVPIDFDLNGLIPFPPPEMKADPTRQDIRETFFIVKSGDDPSNGRERGSSYENPPSGIVDQIQETQGFKSLKFKGHIAPIQRGTFNFILPCDIAAGIYRIYYNSSLVRESGINDPAKVGLCTEQFQVNHRENSVVGEFPTGKMLIIKYDLDTLNLLKKQFPTNSSYLFTDLTTTPAVPDIDQLSEKYPQPDEFYFGEHVIIVWNALGQTRIGYTGGNIQLWPQNSTPVQRQTDIWGHIDVMKEAGYSRQYISKRCECIPEYSVETFEFPKTSNARTAGFPDSSQFLFTFQQFKKPVATSKAFTLTIDPQEASRLQAKAEAEAAERAKAKAKPNANATSNASSSSTASDIGTTGGGEAPLPAQIAHIYTGPTGELPELVTPVIAAAVSQLSIQDKTVWYQNQIKMLTFIMTTRTSLTSAHFQLQQLPLPRMMSENTKITTWYQEQLQLVLKAAGFG